MVCIYCGSETEISNSRNQKKTNSKWRRRTCPHCQATLTTIETFDLSKAVSVRSNKSYQPFSRDKLFISLFYSCKHLKKPELVAGGLTDTIISKLMPRISDATIDISEIIEVSADTLKHFNKAAHVYYLAYHPLQTKNS
ncbi:hypothetical protein KC946_00210 [Candidatus Saccharibacteria bacterium]|nr:hypothetical protein [Candidatus Saccharibacteria bacterium]